MSITIEQLKEIFAKVITEVESLDVVNLSKYKKDKLARNPNTPPKALEQLATDEDSDVRYWVAQNPNTPPKALEQLATDEIYLVRYWVAKHPNTPPKALEQLATDENWDVRYWVARNPNYQKTIQITTKESNALKELLNSTQSEELKSIAAKL